MENTMGSDFFFLIFQPLGLVLLETFLDFFSYIQYCIGIFCLLDSNDRNLKSWFFNLMK